MPFVPPTSGDEVVTPAMSCPADQTSRPVGIVSSTARFITDWETELCVSTTGDCPVTLRVSSRAPTFKSTFTVAVNEAGS